MANFPTSLDGFSTKSAGDTISEAHINDIQSAIAATETKVGIDNSAIVSTTDYKLRYLPEQEQNWDGGNYEVRGQTLNADVVTGTAPLIVASSTKVTNLNADKLDGKNESDIFEPGDAGSGIFGGTFPNLTIAGDTASYTTNGYCKLGYTGLIIQWGQGSSGGSGTEAITFPTAFSTACLQVVACPGDAGPGDANIHCKDLTTTGFNLRHESQERPGRWLAFGY